MKKYLSIAIICYFISIGNCAFAHHHGSCPIYLVDKDYIQQELVFNNCNSHYAIKETVVYFYSNGTRRSYTNCTIYNTDGTIVETDCNSVKHIMFNNKHYFIVYKNKSYSIIDAKGTYLTTKNYKKMQEVAPNRLLVKLGKNYGIINIEEQTIVPIKYKEFEQVEKNLFKTKLNGYWGIVDSNNNILVKNEHDKISQLHETYLLKKMGKYGIVDKNANIILPAECDSIKKLGEYILVEKNNKFDVYSHNGIKINKESYNKIRLNRNNLEGKLPKQGWASIETL